MVMMFAGKVVSVVEGNLVLFIPYKTYGAGVFRSRPNLIRGKAVNSIFQILFVCHSFHIYRANRE
jgi:hypothetical protein